MKAVFINICACCFVNEAGGKSFFKEASFCFVIRLLYGCILPFCRIDLARFVNVLLKLKSNE